MSRIYKGSKVQLEFFSKEGRKVFLDSIVEEFQKDRIILKVQSGHRGNASLLSEGSQVKAYIYTYTGILIANSLVMETNQETAEITIEFKEEQQVIQRRQYFRIPFSTYLILVGEGQEIKGITLDMSGGGIRFQCKEPVKTPAQYNAYLYLSSEDPELPLLGEVTKVPNSEQNEYVLKFTAITEKEREKIIKKCILLERERNKRF